MSDKETMIEWLRNNEDMTLILVEYPDLPDPRWTLVNSVATFQEFFPEHKILETVRGSDYAGSA